MYDKPTAEWTECPNAELKSYLLNAPYIGWQLLKDENDHNRRNINNSLWRKIRLDYFLSTKINSKDMCTNYDPGLLQQNIK